MDERQNSPEMPNAVDEQVSMFSPYVKVLWTYFILV